jgi:ABC-2 type transport system ATP-binding protein
MPVSDDDTERAGLALAALARAGIEVTEFTLGAPSLDEVFLALTGQPATAEEPSSGGNES